MQLRRVVWDNFCQHRALEIEFGPGLTFIVGPNGSGKTNLLNGIVWCLTGVDRNAGLKADNINLHAGAGDRAGVRVVFEHDGALVDVYRSLRRSAPTVRLNNGPPLAGDRAGRSLLRRVLGVPERVLLDYVFVAQRKIFDFLEADPVNAAAALGQLFGTERAALLYGLLGEDHLPDTVVWADSDAVAVRLERLRRDLASAEMVLKELAHLPDPWVEADAPEYATCTALRRWRQLQGDLRVAADEQGAAGALAQLTLLRKQELEGCYHAARAALPGQRTAAALARNGLRDWELYERMTALLAQQEWQKEQFLAELEELRDGAPEQPGDYLYTRDWLSAAEQDAKELRKFLGSWEKTGKAACEACGTPTEVIAERVPEARARLDQLERVIAANRASWERSEAYRAAATRYHNRLARLNAQLEATALSVDPASLPARPVSDREVLDQAVQAALAAEAECDRLAGEVQQAALTWQQAEGYVSQCVQATRRLLDQLEALPTQPTPGTAEVEYTRALAALADARTAAGRRDQAQVAARYLREAVAQDEALLAQARADRERCARANALREHLRELREVFHRDGLAREVAAGYVAAIRDGAGGQPGVNDLLAIFDAPFRVADFVDWRYRVRLASGKEHAALRLSDGQKVLFALAFRVVVNSLFASELGLLCLDEPTAGLDEDNHACLDVALGRLRELSKSRGLQVILVTHDRDVSTADRCYRLAAAR